MNAPNPASSDRDSKRFAARSAPTSLRWRKSSPRSAASSPTIERRRRRARRPRNLPPASGPQIVYANDSIPAPRVVAPPVQEAPVAPAAVPRLSKRRRQPRHCKPPVAPAQNAPFAAAAATAPKIVWEKPARHPRSPLAQECEPTPESVGGGAVRFSRRPKPRSPLPSTPFGDRRDAKRRDDRRPDARNAAPDAQELARRQSAKSCRAAGARRNSAGRARRPLNGALCERSSFKR